MLVEIFKNFLQVNKFFADAAQAEPISEEKFADVCKLAYLAADGEKSAMLRKDLGAMVAYVKQIQRGLKARATDVKTSFRRLSNFLFHFLAQWTRKVSSL